MSDNARAGKLYLKIDGKLYDVKGSFTYNTGQPKREAIVGADGVHGYKETQQVPFIEGEITDRASLDLENLVTIDGATVTLELRNGKVFVLREAWFAGDGSVTTEEAAIAVRFEGMSGEEVK
ncbi:phage tail tube protein [Desulfocurvibacter africanus]|uniref:Tail tube protein, bacteriophage n=1 Tax=Desulfocurvibacter africanus subsp. africanus str. Walvis Bay TaxID=690850 RepID=F3Z2T5_DESAF|nr:phage tail tube protein [Desulfocurvibacter africanus]EGJ50252.1 Tail tube protein, bacteriophage [Desulfocurvibacter africanus subsp. africanus str. Walvis Bay]